MTYPAVYSINIKFNVTSPSDRFIEYVVWFLRFFTFNQNVDLINVNPDDQGTTDRWVVLLGNVVRMT